MDDPPQSAAEWQRVVEAAGPASLLVVIDARMSRTLKARMTPEDVLQESLLQAWRDRQRLEWKGLRAFRAWLLTIIDNRIRDAAAHEGAQKRGGGATLRPLDAADGSDQGNPLFEPIASTTPSRAAVYAEQAAAIAEAMDALPPEVRDVVWMRLLEQLPIADIAARLDIGESAVRHRFRKGAALYRQRLLRVLSSRFTVSNRDSEAKPPPDAAS